MMRRVLAIALSFAAAACSWDARPTPLTDALLDAAGRWGGGADRRTFAQTELDRIASRIRERAGSLPHHELLAEVVFRELGYTREVEDESLDYVLLPSVLEHRRGSCVGLGTLYLALAERLGWRMYGVLLPGHFYVTTEGHNLELLHRGEAMPDDWHRQRFARGRALVRAYARALTPEEVLGIVEYDLGNQRKRMGRLVDAQRAYDSARKHFPDFAEAHASAGAVAHLLGNLDASLAAYREAERNNPELPGLQANIALLQAER